MPVDLTQFPLLNAYLRDQFGSHPPNLEIHPKDEMFTPSSDIDQQTLDHSLVLYFRAGVAMLRSIEQIAAFHFGSSDRVGSVLDFASGFGRAARFLVQRFGPRKVAVAEISPDAVEFQKSQFGVQGYLSTSEPDQFVCDRAFDVIFAASLFTHLPQRTFLGWLSRLGSLLTPEGVLIFSLHNQRSFAFHESARRNIPEDEEFVFDESQWSGHLSPRDYGNTLVSDAFVRRALTQCMGSHSYLRIPFGHVAFQDLCVVVRKPNASLESFCLDYGPEGTLEGARKEPDGRLSIRGWTASRNRCAPVQNIRLTLDGRTIAEVTPTIPRPEVTAHLGDIAPMHPGWQCSLDYPKWVTDSSVLQARAITSSGLDWLFYIGSLDNALRRTTIWEAPRPLNEADRTHAALMKLVAHLETERSELRNRIRTMEASRFWKARRLWFAFKRRLGLTREL